jgi:uncharacterized membrane protein YkvA (DUF1232 family)
MGLLRLLLTSRRTIVRAWRLARDQRVPKRFKIMALLGALLILSPLNILGDIPLLGLVDDAALLGFLLSWFVRVAGPLATHDINHTAG